MLQTATVGLLLFVIVLAVSLTENNYIYWVLYCFISIGMLPLMCEEIQSPQLVSLSSLSLLPAEGIILILFHLHNLLFLQIFEEIQKKSIIYK